MISLDDIEAAAAIVYKVMPPTPQYRWLQLSERLGCAVWVKHENHSPIGCFKLRGGLAYLDHLKRTNPNVAAVVAPTRGNHGQSIALAASLYGIPAIIVMPRGNLPEKNDAVRALGATIIEHGDDYQEAREFAIRMVEDRGLHMVRSFTPQLLRGVATYPLELFRAVDRIDTIYVQIGMGSGVCATLLVRDLLQLNTEVVGVVADGAPTYALSYAAGRPVPTERADTIADGMACRTPDPGVVDLICRRAQRIVRVTDEEIRQAAALYFTTTHNLAEFSGAASLAALMQERDRMQGRRVAVVLSGGNLDSSLLPVLASTARSQQLAQPTYRI